MDLLEQIISSDDDAFFCEEADSKTLEVPKPSSNKKRKKNDNLEEGEIEEWYSFCNGFFFRHNRYEKSTGMCRMPQRNFLWTS